MRRIDSQWSVGSGQWVVGSGCEDNPLIFLSDTIAYSKSAVVENNGSNARGWSLLPAGNK